MPGPSIHGERPARIALWVGAAATGLTVVLLLRTLPGAPGGAEEVPGTLAYAALTAAPLALAAGSVRGRAALLAPASVVAIGSSPLLWSGMLLLLAPGLLYLWAFARMRPRRPSGGRRLAAVSMPPLLVLSGWLVLMTGGPERCTRSQGGVSCGDVLPAGAALGSFSLAAAGVVAGWVLASPPKAGGPTPPVSRG